MATRHRGGSRRGANPERGAQPCPPHARLPAASLQRGLEINSALNRLLGRGSPFSQKTFVLFSDLTRAFRGHRSLPAPSGLLRGTATNYAFPLRLQSPCAKRRSRPLYRLNRTCPGRRCGGRSRSRRRSGPAHTPCRRHAHSVSSAHGLSALHQYGGAERRGARRGLVRAMGRGRGGEASA